jgi:hypothetical protein
VADFALCVALALATAVDQGRITVEKPLGVIVYGASSAALIVPGASLSPVIVPFLICEPSISKDFAAIPVPVIAITKAMTATTIAGLGFENFISPTPPGVFARPSQRQGRYLIVEGD